MPVNILGGNNSLQNNKSIFSTLGKKCLIVTGKSSAKKSGALDELINVFNELDIEMLKTHRDGNIVFVSDGKKVSLSKSLEG